MVMHCSAFAPSSVVARTVTVYSPFVSAPSLVVQSSMIAVPTLSDRSCFSTTVPWASVTTSVRLSTTGRTLAGSLACSVDGSSAYTQVSPLRTSDLHCSDSVVV